MIRLPCSKRNFARLYHIDARWQHARSPPGTPGNPGLADPRNATCAPKDNRRRRPPADHHPVW
eukprot:7970243-Heterocapsa_arctica.AAC.1